MKYQVQVVCDQGAYRANNEDAIRYGVLHEIGILWMVIADGMGGHKAGEVASEMLVSHLEGSFNGLKNVPAQGWALWSKQQILKVNQSIFDAAQTNFNYQGMGTTGVLIVVDNQQMHTSWVGDSRAYLLREKNLVQITKDHTMIQYLLDKGSITLKDAERSNTRHLLSRAIGVKAEVDVDYRSESIRPGDAIMLSTDGLHDRLSREVITGYLAMFSAGEQVGADMVNQAIAQGSKDNLTVGIVKVSD